MEHAETIIAGVVIAAILVAVIRTVGRSAIERADVAAYIDEQVVHILAQRIGRGIEDVRAVVQGRGRADIAQRLGETRWFATVQFQRRDRACVVRVVVSFPGARVVRERPVDWRDVPPHVRSELMRAAQTAVTRPWQSLWSQRIAA